MKKYLLILLALFAVAIPSSAQEWVNILDNEDMSLSIYLDFDKNYDGSLSFWFKEEYKTPQRRLNEKQGCNLS